MGLLNAEVQKQVQEELVRLVHPVKLVVFTQEFECQYCSETRTLIEEVAALSDKLSVEVFDFVSDKEVVEEFGIDKIPAVAVVAGGEEAKDYGIRFYGIPSGYEFSTLIEDIVMVSAQESGLSAQTIAELGGGKTPSDWNGSSMLPWLDDPRTGWQDIAVSEYYGHNIASGFAMLRKGQYKYVYHTPPDAEHPAERELYDLAADPGEFTNLARQKKYSEQVRALHALLVNELGEHPDQAEQRCRADYRRGYSRNREKRT